MDIYDSYYEPMIRENKEREAKDFEDCQREKDRRDAISEFQRKNIPLNPVIVETSVEMCSQQREQKIADEASRKAAQAAGYLALAYTLSIGVGGLVGLAIKYATKKTVRKITQP